MKRRTFDLTAVLIGALLTLTLFAASALLGWGYSFDNHSVASQLSAQKIIMPADTLNKNQDAATTAFFAANANKTMSTGKQAQMYADHYLGFHLSSMPTYAQASANSRTAGASLALSPTDPALQDAATKAAATLDTVFKGTMLRGTLLTSYAFWQLGQIAQIAAYASALAALLMLLLVILGLAHMRKTSPEVRL